MYEDFETKMREQERQIDERRWIRALWMLYALGVAALSLLSYAVFVWLPGL